MQLGNRLSEQRGQSASEGVERLLIPGHFEPEAAVFGHQEGIGRPFLAVYVQPHHAPELQFHQGGDFLRTVFR